MPAPRSPAVAWPEAVGGGRALRLAARGTVEGDALAHRAATRYQAGLGLTASLLMWA
ncbi:hypothetical protein AB0D04_11235 [Streptomyces sp. NPDC048483]|uniref:hypothetical protein n=1 Tax=Streptomyces sp. NPDC048483 TaxID=3154927 RepID=UPI003440D8A6